MTIEFSVCATRWAFPLYVYWARHYQYVCIQVLFVRIYIEWAEVNRTKFDVEPINEFMSPRMFAPVMAFDPSLQCVRCPNCGHNLKRIA